MTTTDDTTTRVRGMRGLLAAVPALLGFHPTRSLVLVCMSGAEREVRPVIRLDLPSTSSPELARLVAGYAQRFAHEVAVVCYTESAFRPAALDGVLRAIAAAGIPVLDVLQVHRGRAWSTRTRSRARGRTFAVPDDRDPQVQGLAVRTALAGRSVLPSREALAASVAGPTGDRLAAAERAIDAAAGGPLARDVTQLVDRCLAAIDESGAVPAELAASMAVAVQQIPVRDAVLARAVVELDRPWVSMLIGCARWTPDAQAAELCVVLAVAAYRHGDGALAQVSLDRTLTAEPGHRFAGLLVQALMAGIRPEDFERLAAPEPPPRRAPLSASRRRVRR